VAFRLATAQVEFTSVDKGLRKSLTRIRTSLNSLRSSVLKIAGPLAAVFGARVAIRGAIEQEAAQARVAAVLAQTGEAAGFTFKQLNKLAQAFQKVGVIGDEVVLNAEAILLTFTNIRGEVFLRGLAAALDLAALKSQDAATTAELFAKALNDPVKGVTMLRKAGVGFTNQVIEQISVLVAQGKLFEAQVIILEEIESQLGGVNAALAKTPTGKLRQLANAFGDLLEEVGKGFAVGLADAFNSIQDFFETVVPIVRAVASIIARIIGSIVQTVQAGAEGLAKSLGFEDAQIGARQLEGFLLKVFLNIQKALVAFGQVVAQVVSVILTAFKQLSSAVEVLAFGKIKADPAAFDQVIGVVDDFAKGLGEKKKAIEKEINSIKLLFALGAVVDQVKDFTDLLGLTKRETPEVKVTLPKIPGAARAAKAKIILEAPEDVLRRIQESIKTKDDPIAAQKETTKAVADVKKGIDALKAAGKTNNNTLVEAIGELDLSTEFQPGAPD